MVAKIYARFMGTWFVIEGGKVEKVWMPPTEVLLSTDNSQGSVVVEYRTNAKGKLEATSLPLSMEAEVEIARLVHHLYDAQHQVVSLQTALETAQADAAHYKRMYNSEKALYASYRSSHSGDFENGVTLGALGFGFLGLIIGLISASGSSSAPVRTVYMMPVGEG
jgi:hypothetical protein